MKKKAAQKANENHQLIIPAEFQQGTDQDVTALCPLIRADHERFVESARTAIQSTLSCGCRLTSAKELAGHGRWEKLFKSELQPLLNFDLRTAQRHMATYAAFRRFQNEQPVEASQSLQDSEQLVNAFKMHWKDDPGAELDPNEWMTPPQLVQVVERLLEVIDCDPAATPQQVKDCPHGQTRYGRTENGLATQRHWKGKVFAAPGHSGSMTPWLEKALAEFNSGRMTAGVLLVPATFSADWPLALAQFPLAITREAPRVLVTKDQEVVSKRLRCRLLLIYLTPDPDWAAFENSINDTFVVFGGSFQPRATTTLAFSQAS